MPSRIGEGKSEAKIDLLVVIIRTEKVTRKREEKTRKSTGEYRREKVRLIRVIVRLRPLFSYAKRSWLRG